MGKSVKICHVFTTFYPGPGALERTFALVMDQKQQGRQSEFITGVNGSRDLIHEKRQEGFHITQINSLRKYVHPLHDIKAVLDLARLFRKRRYDLVHTHFAKAGIIGRLAAKLAGVRIIIHSVYGATFAPTQLLRKKIVFRELERLAERITNKFVFVGRELRDYYMKEGVCPFHKTTQIYGGRDLSVFIDNAAYSEGDRKARKLAMGIDPQTIVLGNVSRIVPWKGHLQALEIFHNLKQEIGNLKLIIVGEAKVPSEKAYKAKLMSRSKALGIEEDVIFTGWQQDTARYYSIFDIYLITSEPFEGVPGSVIEAVVSGVPVVAGFDCFGVREIPGINARLVPNKDLKGLTAVLRDEIAKLETSPCPSITRNEIQSLQDRFSIDRMIVETRKLYTQLLNNPDSIS